MGTDICRTFLAELGFELGYKCSHLASVLCIVKHRSKVYDNQVSPLTILNLYTSKDSNLWKHRLLNKAKNPRLADRVKMKCLNYGGGDDGQGQFLL